MFSFLLNLKNTENLGLFFLTLVPVAFIVGSFATNLLIIILVLFYLFFQKRENIKKFFVKYKWQIILLILITLLNIIFSDVREYSFSKLVPFYRFFIFSLSIIFILKIISNKINNYVNLLFIILFFLIIDVYIQLYFGRNIFGFPFNEEYGRITGAFNDEMIIGNFLLYFGFLTLSLLNYTYQLNLTKNGILILLISLTILITGERTPFISLFYLSFFIFLFSKRKKFIFFTSLFLITLSIIIISNSERLTNKYSVTSIPKLTDIDSKTFRNNSAEESLNESEYEMKLKKNDDNFLNSLSLSFRSNQYVGHYSRALDIIKQNYIFGSGFKSYRKICGSYETLKQPNQYNTDENRRLTCSIHPHNYHLEILSDTGITGYIIFLSLIFYICFTFFKKKLYKDFSICILFCLIITYIFPFKPSGSFFSTNSAFIFWYLIGHFFYFSNNSRKI